MDALPDTHVGVTVNDIDISRQGTWDEIDGLPEVRGRLAAERNELVAMGFPVITGTGGIEADHLLHFRRSHLTPLTRTSPSPETGDTDNAIRRTTENIDIQTIRRSSRVIRNRQDRQLVRSRPANAFIGQVISTVAMYICHKVASRSPATLQSIRNSGRILHTAPPTAASRSDNEFAEGIITGNEKNRSQRHGRFLIYKSITWLSNKAHTSYPRRQSPS